MNILFVSNTQIQLQKKIQLNVNNNSYKNLHKKFTRVTPEMWQNHELAVSLYDLHIAKLPSADWQILQNNILQNRRSPKLQFTKQFMMQIKRFTKSS
jgi:hypothetical protein